MILKIPKISVSTIFVLIPLLYFNSCTFEFIKHFSSVLPVVIACIALWGLCLGVERVPIQIHHILPMAGYFAIVCVLFLVGLQERVNVLENDLTNTLFMLFFLCVFTVYSEEQYVQDRSVILVVCIADVIISCAYSVYRLIDEPNLSRLMSTGSYHETDAATMARGIVSYGVVYGLVLLMLVVFYWILQQKKNRIFHILLMVLFLATLFLAQFLIAICLLGIGVIWIFCSNSFNNNTKPTRIFYLTLLGLFGVFIFPIVIKVIVDSDIFRYEINARLEEILFLFNGESIEGTDISVRFVQYITSLNAFTSTFGLGKIFVSSVEVGSHSQWLDGFGNYGLLYVLYIVAIVTFYKFVSQRLENFKAKQLYRIVFAVYVIMSLTNTSTWAPITLSLFVIVPFWCMDRVAE